MAKKVIITGASGMVGRGVLLECLDSPLIANVLLVNRSTIDIKHPKLTEVLLTDFTQIDTIKSQLQGYDACFFCMGVSSIGMNEETFTKLTFDTAKAFADTLYEQNPMMVFNYVSGTGTDSSEKGSVMWARVKGKTENWILNKGFKDAYMFRPGVILPEKGIQSKTGWYNFFYVVFRPFFPLLKKLKNITSTTQVGLAMINTLVKPFDKKHLENVAINVLAGK